MSRQHVCCMRLHAGALQPGRAAARPLKQRARAAQTVAPAVGRGVAAGERLCQQCVLHRSSVPSSLSKPSVPSSYAPSPAANNHPSAGPLAHMRAPTAVSDGDRVHIASLVHSEDDSSSRGELVGLVFLLSMWLMGWKACRQQATFSRSAACLQQPPGSRPKATCQQQPLHPAAPLPRPDVPCCAAIRCSVRLPGFPREPGGPGAAGGHAQLPARHGGAACAARRLGQPALLRRRGQPPREAGGGRGGGRGGARDHRDAAICAARGARCALRCAAPTCPALWQAALRPHALPCGRQRCLLCGRQQLAGSTYCW